MDINTNAVAAPASFKVSRMVRINEAAPDKNTLAFADVLIKDTVIVKGWRVVRGKKGIFVSQPQTQGKDKKYYSDIFFPSLDELQEAQRTVLLHFERTYPGVK